MSDKEWTDEDQEWLDRFDGNADDQTEIDNLDEEWWELDPNEGDDDDEPVQSTE